MSSRSSFFLSAVALLLIIGCQKGLVKTQYRAIEGSWNKDDPIEFAISGIVDTLERHHIFINIRNDNDYPYSNLFLIAKLAFPNGDMVIDTLEYEMAEPNGEWLGHGKGSIKENRLWYKENIVFPSNGVYTLSLSHAMRRNGSVQGVVNLPGITDVGYEIVKNDK